MSEQLNRIEGKVDCLAAQVVALDTKVDHLDRGLAVHKVKTGWIAVTVGGVASLLVALAAVLLKGCG